MALVLWGNCWLSLVVLVAIHDAQCIIKSASEFPAGRGKKLVQNFKDPIACLC
jgi:hypothetical protein